MKYDMVEEYGACGVRHINCFTDDDDEYGEGSWDLADLQIGAANLCMAAFVKDDRKSDEAYEELKNKFKIAYESSWRLNKNSNHMFKFVVYDGEN